MGEFIHLTHLRDTTNVPDTALVPGDIQQGTTQTKISAFVEHAVHELGWKRGLGVCEGQGQSTSQLLWLQAYLMKS